MESDDFDARNIYSRSSGKMKNTWIIVLRELKERIKKTSFWGLALVGPIVLMLLVFLLFHFGESKKERWKILIADPAMVMDNRILLGDAGAFEFDFINDYLDLDDFLKGKRYQAYDGFLEVNEKVLSNKRALFFYKEKPSLKIQTRLHYLLEKRLEEVYVSELTKISLQQYREIKQPINLGFRNIYDPENQKSDVNSWVGWFFGAIVLFYIFIFGMAILRSITVEKSNRIVEVLLATVQPKQLMLGKIIGIGLSALIQLFIWVLIISIGMYIFKEQFFQTLNDQALAGNLQSGSGVKEVFGFTNLLEYNQFVELVFQWINFPVLLSFASLFLVLGYLFYGTFFAGLGAMTGTESDGQQYVILIIAILFFALLSGYMTIIYADSPMVYWLQYIPFTSPIVCMVKISQGYASTEIYQLILSILILIISIFIGLIFAGKQYQRGILRFGHRLKFVDFFRR
ncbi:MAG TPA: ABC transporter permease [Crocinitomicaceae bacterium]|nr:ABC transporter permease [Crocinitomicaceae bacterium]